MTDLSYSRYWSEKHRAYRVDELRWFIKKANQLLSLYPQDTDEKIQNEPVQEGKSQKFRFSKSYAVSAGRPKSSSVTIYHDSNSPTAPLHEDENVEVLVNLVADLSHLDESDLSRTISTLADGQDYYRMKGCIEVTYYAATTKYALIYEGVYTVPYFLFSVLKI